MASNPCPYDQELDSACEYQGNYGECIGCQRNVDVTDYDIYLHEQGRFDPDPDELSRVDPFDP